MPTILTADAKRGLSRRYLKNVTNGRLLPRNMRQELITEDELLSQLHHAGLEELSQVREAYIEGDGMITFIRSKA